MASVKQLKYNLPGEGGEVFYPLTTTEAVEDENGKALDLILTDVMGSMGDAFSETASYEVGDYCIYQDVLYKFIAEKSAGAWDVNAVSKTTIDAELKSLLNQINTLNNGIFRDIRLAVKQVSTNSNTKIKIQYGQNTGTHQFALIYGDFNGNPFLAISNTNGAATIHAIGGEKIERNNEERSCIISTQPWSKVWILLDEEFVDDIEISVYS